MGPSINILAIAALSLYWTIPVEREDGSELLIDEINGYRVYIDEIRQTSLIPATDESAEFPDLDYACFKMTTIAKSTDDDPELESRFSNEVCKGDRPTFPVELIGDYPEQREIQFFVEKPADATLAVIELSVFDADFPDEGTLVINGSDSIGLFGDVADHDGEDVDIIISSPASVWVDGSNTLLFTHDKTNGYIINSIEIVFTTNATSQPNPPIMTE